MDSRVHTATLFALYQLSLFAGLLLLPVAMVTQQFGLRLPVDRAISTLNEAYEQSQA